MSTCSSSSQHGIALEVSRELGVRTQCRPQSIPRRTGPRVRVSRRAAHYRTTRDVSTGVRGAAGLGCDSKHWRERRGGPSLAAPCITAGCRPGQCRATAVGKVSDRLSRRGWAVGPVGQGCRTSRTQGRPARQRPPPPAHPPGSSPAPEILPRRRATRGCPGTRTRTPQKRGQSLPVDRADTGEQGGRVH